ncbi:MAG: endonuclease/exonuclease/phosphatase family protein [Bacteroidota bacterium]
MKILAALKKLLLTFSRISFILLIICSLLSSMGDQPYWLGLFSHFKFHLFLFTIPFLLFFTLVRKWIWMILALALLFLNSLPLVPYYVPANIPDKVTPSISILSHNVKFTNEAYKTERNFILEQDPDILVLLEFTPSWYDSMAIVWKQYPHRRVIARSDFFGGMLASKYPLEEPAARWFGPMDVPSITANVHHPLGDVHVIACHPPSPPDTHDIHLRNLLMDSMSVYIQNQDLPVIVAGDLNNTPFHPAFRSFIKSSGLRDARKGFGYLPTWPKQLGLLKIPLDFFLVSDKIEVRDFEVHHRGFSDHDPISGKFTLKPKF